MNAWLLIKRFLITRKCVLCRDVIDYKRIDPICDDCESEWDDFLEHRCNRCGADRHSCNCVPLLIKKHFPRYCWSVFYNPKGQENADKLVYALKYERNIAFSEFCARTIKNSLMYYCHKHNINYKEFAVTYVPRRKWNKRIYWLDHSRDLAKHLAKMLDLDFVEAIENNGTKDQKTLSAIERRRNAQSAFSLKKNFENKHKKYFLVDDIMTTGSTLVYCSRVLMEAGATEIIPVTYAKDNYKTKGDY